MEISVGTLLILHHGYTPEVINERNKVQRNYELLLKALEERPNEAYFYMQLGLELRRLERLDESFEAYAKALKLAETQPNQFITEEVRETLLTQYSGYLFADKQYGKVLEVLTGDLALLNRLTPGQLLVRGCALIHLKQFDYALRDILDAHNRREEATLFPSAIDPVGTPADALLAEALYLNHRFDTAIPYFESVVQNSNPNLRTILAYANCLNAVGKIQEALELLHQHALLKRNMSELWDHGLKLIRGNQNLGEIADEWIEQIKIHENKII